MAKRRRQRGGAGGAKRFSIRRSLRFVMRAGFALAVVAGGAWVAFGGGAQRLAERASEVRDAAFALAGLRVGDVTVSGRHYTSASELLDALDVARGDPITSFDPVAARERVVALDWVRSARVMRLFPNTIHVEIVEHQPIAIWQNGSAATLVDERGVVVTDLDVRSFAHLPRVIGAGGASAAPAFLAELEARPAIARRVRSSLRVGDRRWSLELDNGVIVHLPEEGIGRALDALVSLNESEGLVDRDVAIVDMRLPDRLTVVPGRDGRGNSPAAAPSEAGARS